SPEHSDHIFHTPHFRISVRMLAPGSKFKVIYGHTGSGSTFEDIYGDTDSRLKIRRHLLRY
ncbi:hypothetical protein BgiMline_000885, partial [Biomphalaria glabrata]